MYDYYKNIFKKEERLNIIKMSAQFFQSNTPTETQSIKCNDLTVRGNLAAVNGLSAASITTSGNIQTTAGNLISAGLLTGKVTFQPLPVQYTQVTSPSTTVTVGEFDQSVDITTFSLTTPAAGLEAFVVGHAGVNSNTMFVATLVSQTGTYNVNGAPLVYVIAVSDGAFNIGIKNIGAGAFSGPLKIRIKLLSNVAA